MVAGEFRHFPKWIDQNWQELTRIFHDILWYIIKILLSCLISFLSYNLLNLKTHSTCQARPKDVAFWIVFAHTSKDQVRKSMTNWKFLPFAFRTRIIWISNGCSVKNNLWIYVGVLNSNHLFNILPLFPLVPHSGML